MKRENDNFMERNPEPLWEYIPTIAVMGLGILGYHEAIEYLDDRNGGCIGKVVEDEISDSRGFDDLTKEVEYSIPELNYTVENEK